MRRRPRRSHLMDPCTYLPLNQYVYGRDVLARRDMFEELMIARCARCGGRLVARVNRRGPYFHCLCLERKAG